jgi:hypothetical protein
MEVFLLMMKKHQRAVTTIGARSSQQKFLPLAATPDLRPGARARCPGLQPPHTAPVIRRITANILPYPSLFLPPYLLRYFPLLDITAIMSNSLL